MFFKTAKKVTDFAGLTTPSDNLDLDQDVANEEVTEDMEEDQSTNMSPNQKRLTSLMKEVIELKLKEAEAILYPIVGEVKGLKKGYYCECPNCAEVTLSWEEPEEEDEDGDPLSFCCPHCSEETLVEDLGFWETRHPDVEDLESYNNCGYYYQSLARCVGDIRSKGLKDKTMYHHYIHNLAYNLENATQELALKEKEDEEDAF